ncbi:MAG: hypothetical protein P4M11_11890 [Candidatus Pacebacteria bacterium]|nr:hypothetical protein [Candidatus Paceibacterota bacterium]
MGVIGLRQYYVIYCKENSTIGFIVYEIAAPSKIGRSRPTLPACCSSSCQS